MPNTIAENTSKNTADNIDLHFAVPLKTILWASGVFLLSFLSLYFLNFATLVNSMLVSLIITEIVFLLESRIFFILALLFLVLVIIFVGLKNDVAAEKFAILVYELLVAGVFVEFVQMGILNYKENYHHKIVKYLPTIKIPKIKLSYEITWK
jgi:hypothetical protein